MPVHLEQDRVRGDEVADAMADHDDRIVAGRPGEQALVIDCLQRSRFLASDDERGRPGEDLVELGVGAGAAPRARQLDRLAEGLPPGVGRKRGHLDRAEAMEAAVEEDEKQDEPGADEESRTP